MALLLPPPAGGPVIPAGLSPHGNQLTADLNNLITLPITFCTSGIFARLRQASGTQTLTSGSTNVIAYDTIDEDPYSGWSATSTATQAAHSWQPPAGASGWYHVRITVSLGTVPSDSVLRPVILVTGTTAYFLETPKASPSQPMTAQGSGLVYLLGGADYVQAGAFFNSGSGNEPTSISPAAAQPLMEVSWESN